MVVKTARKSSGATTTHRTTGPRAAATDTSASQKGLQVQRRWTRKNVHPFDDISWERRTAAITSENGEIVFEQHDVEVPTFWTQLATNVVVSKYFRGALGTPQREDSIKQVVSRVADTIADWGIKDGYFASKDDADAFRAELSYLLVNQYASFNSPVWFNVGVERNRRPQCSACQPYHALINTANGLMPIGEIVEKNLISLPVYDSNGLTQVVAVKHNGRKPVYRIRLNDGFSVEATGDHLVCAHEVRRTREVEWHRVDQLTPGMVMRVYAHASKTSMVPTQVRTVAEAALAGWLQADGFVGQYAHGTNRSLTMEFMTVDDQEFDWVMRHIEEAFPAHHYRVSDVTTTDSSLRCRRIRLYGETLRPFVERYGLLQRGQDLRVPQPIWSAPDDAVAAYVKSLFQADGYAAVHVPSTHIGFAVTSKMWAEELQRLLTRFGIYAPLRQKKERRPDRYDTWELDVSIRSEREAFQRSIGFISERKNAKLRESLQIAGKRCPDVRYSTIVSIEPLGEMDVYDIQTLSGCYLTNSVLVHNCFILSVEDSMESIFEWYRNEGMIFKFGSGAGLNVSSLRSSRERLGDGGIPSGPVSFMRAADASAGVIKSGGKTRRAAKMLILNADHPDIKDFIECKWKEEEKAHKLIDLGYDGSIGGEAYASVFFQNANNSVRVTDEFMKRVINDKEWELRAVTTNEVVERLKARDLLRLIAEATWHCGDPGMQFDTTINDWHTCSNSGPITASNPCSEYMSLNDSACNLSSINLLKFLDSEGNFLVESFKAATRIMIIAQDIIVDNSSYPTAKIEQTSHNFRQLGLGYANLGAVLMSLGVAYDSDEGRAWAGAITALMCAHAYEVSGEMAQQLGAYAGFRLNRAAHIRVLHRHRAKVDDINAQLVPSSLLNAARRAWDAAIVWGEKLGVRNSQVTVLAPTGTIAFMMDCDTTGIEPDIALIKYKRLVGGGMLKIVNQTVSRSLIRLGYSPDEIEAIHQYLEEKETIEGAPGLKVEHLPIFDCAFRPRNGTRLIHHMGHVRMMGAVQPFISGAISKCVTGDTLVPTNKGLLPIARFYNEEMPDSFKSLEVDVVSVDGLRQTEQFYVGGVQNVIQAVLRDGRRIEATPNHRLYVASSQGLSWKRMDELETGDHVAIKLGDRLWAEEDADLASFVASKPCGRQKRILVPERMTPELAWLLGAYTAEGNITGSNWTVAIHNNSEVIQSKIRRIVWDLFGLPVDVRQERTVISCKVTSKTLVEFLRFCGVGEGAAHKVVPWTILQSSEACVRAFISGVYLDGYIPENLSKVGFCVASPRLVDELQVILNNFGILAAQIHKRNVELQKDYFELNVFGRHAQTFVREFAFDESKKQERAKRLLQRIFAHSWSDAVPCFDSRGAFVGAARRVKALYQNQAYGNPNTIAWDTLKRLVDDPDVPTTDDMEFIVRNDIHFVPVRRLISGGRGPVYDFSVPDAHAFVGNGIVNHNTVNMREEATIEEIMQVYLEAWRLGVKAIAIYRDGSKKIQPLSTGKGDGGKVALVPAGTPYRRRLADERQSITHKFSIGGHEGYLTVGLFDDGSPGEIFIVMSKEGSTLSGVMDCFATTVSLALQYGVPLKVLVNKFSHVRFEPSGITNTKNVRFAKSVVDYIFRWMALKFLPSDQAQAVNVSDAAEMKSDTSLRPNAPISVAGDNGRANPMEKEEHVTFIAQADAPACSDCGSIMVRNGACYKCMNCGTTSGCS